MNLKNIFVFSLCLLITQNNLVFANSKINTDAADVSSESVYCKNFKDNAQNIEFGNIVGYKEEKEEISYAFKVFKYGDEFGIDKTGLLLYGPSGNGKTVLAQSLANDKEITFNYLDCSYLSYENLQNTYNDIEKTNHKTVLVLDNLNSLNLANDKDRRMFFIGLDYLQSNKNIFLIGITENLNDLKKEFTEKNRFYKKLFIGCPTAEEKQEILKFYTKDKNLALDVNFEVISKITNGDSVVNLKNIINEATLIALRRNSNVINMDDFIRAIENERFGFKNKISLSEKEKLETAIHETGHALTLHYLCKDTKLIKISLIPRKNALGYNWMYSPNNKCYSKDFLINMISMSLGGYAAEKFKLGHTSAGCISDLDFARSTARDMVLKYGMSDSGISFNGVENSEIVQKEVNKILKNCCNQALHVIKKHKKLFNSVVDYLIKHSEISSSEFEKLIDDNK